MPAPVILVAPRQQVAGTCTLSASDPANDWVTGFISSASTIHDLHLTTAATAVHDLVANPLANFTTIESCRTYCSGLNNCFLFGYNSALQQCAPKKLEAKVNSYMCIPGGTGGASISVASTTVSAGNSKSATLSSFESSGSSSPGSIATIGTAPVQSAGVDGLTIGIVSGLVGVILLGLGIFLGVLLSRRVRRAKEAAAAEQENIITNSTVQNSNPSSNPSNTLSSWNSNQQSDLNRQSAYVRPKSDQISYLYTSNNPAFNQPNPSNEYLPPQPQQYYGQEPANLYRDSLLSVQNAGNPYRESYMSGTSSAQNTEFNSLYSADGIPAPRRI
ncbi:hypothetical protein HK096_010518 [Nowakowskiella sp. JEL0078]|nr:hypothetical protein HK096_010518 [Nowakowskiella sp. JEL0078]